MALMVKKQKTKNNTTPANVVDVRDMGWIHGSGRKPLEEGMTIYSTVLAWRISWTEKPCGLQSLGSQRVRHDCNDPVKGVSMQSSTECDRKLLLVTRSNVSIHGFSAFLYTRKHRKLGQKSLLFLDIIVIFPAFMEMVVYGKKYTKQILMDV